MERRLYITETALKIGEVARLVSIPAKTLRYYEEIGLLSPAGRTDSGYRLYGWREMEQIEFVRRAKLMGLSLEEIKSLVHAAEDGIPNKVFQRLDGLLESSLEDTERKIEELRAFRKSLLEYRERASENEALGECRCGERGKNEFCGCLDAVTNGVTPPDLRVIQQNNRFVKKAEESGRCQCGCCQPTSNEVV